MRALIELTFGRCGCRECRMDRREWRWFLTDAKPGALGIQPEDAPPICRHPDPVQACRVCGCWHYDACLGDDEEPCHWVEPDLCSACAVPERPPPAELVLLTFPG